MTCHPKDLASYRTRFILRICAQTRRFSSPERRHNHALFHAERTGYWLDVTACDRVVEAYGAETGNLALRAVATGGVFVGGGIAPKILDKLKDGTFMKAFVDKGRYTDLLAATPVQVILNPQAALRGAAYYAAFLARD